MHSYLIQNIHAEQNIYMYFCLKNEKFKLVFPNMFISLIKACQMHFKYFN